MPYPVPENLVGEVVENCQKILVVEEGDPVVETQLRVLAGARHGKATILGKMFDGVLPLFGELNTDKVAAALARILEIPLAGDPDREQVKAEVSAKIPPRSSTLCAGCPHLGTYWAINQVVKADKKRFPVVNGDIGCYEQGGYGIKGQMPVPSDEDAARYISKTPYDLLDTIYVMGSGISMAQGQARSGFTQGRFLAVAGDSTFFHSGMPGLLNAIWNGTKVAFVVMDNSWTAMTGHQVCPATGLTPLGAPAKAIKVEEVARSLGVEMVEVTNPYRLDDVMAAVRKALDFEGVAVVVSRGECILQVNRRQGKSKVRTVVTDDCTGCKVCTQIGCPAIAFQGERANIDDLLCVSCGICIQACPENAILERRMAKQE
jgi:indolepyruvate ferredoxin oxidoreductase alpha subunit